MIITYLPPQSCQRASGHQAGCRAPDSRAPSRRYQSGRRPAQRELRYTRAEKRSAVRRGLTGTCQYWQLLEISQPRKGAGLTRVRSGSVPTFGRTMSPSHQTSQSGGPCLFFLQSARGQSSVIPTTEDWLLEPRRRGTLGGGTSNQRKY